MPRRLRIASGGYSYHVLNRAAGRARIFSKERDFEAVEEGIAEVKERLPLPRRWRQHVQRPQTEAELEALRHSVVRGAPFGEASWQERTAKKLDLQSTLRPRARPRKTSPKPD